jgi:pimeloyl-ACP methyl ester carboxylesterase
VTEEIAAATRTTALLVDVGTGVRLACRATPGRGGEPVVLLHAHGETGRPWEPVADAFGGRPTYALDLRGHGDSDRLGDYSVALMRDDVVGLLGALGLDRVSVVAHSLGAMVACLVAEAVPDRVGTLVLEDPHPLRRADPPRELPPRPAGALDFDWEMVGQLLPLRNDPDPAWWDALDRITARTLVVAGGPPSHLPQDEIAELAARIPGGRLVTVPVGHEVHANAPAEFVRIVRTFLEAG